MKFITELENAMLKEDFYETNEVIEKIRQEKDAFNYLQVIFNIMENNPELDYGMPGPVVHFMEGYYGRGYEEILLRSVQNTPTSHTIWMLNRVINAPKLSNREIYIEVLKSLLNRNDISKFVKADIENFLKYQQNK